MPAATNHKKLMAKNLSRILIIAIIPILLCISASAQETQYNNSDHLLMSLNPATVNGQ